MVSNALGSFGAVREVGFLVCADVFFTSTHERISVNILGQLNISQGRINDRLSSALNKVFSSLNGLAVFFKNHFRDFLDGFLHLRRLFVERFLHIKEFIHFRNLNLERTTVAILLDNDAVYRQALDFINILVYVAFRVLLSDGLNCFGLDFLQLFLSQLVAKFRDSTSDSVVDSVLGNGVIEERTALVLTTINLDDRLRGRNHIAVELCDVLELCKVQAPAPSAVTLASANELGGELRVLNSAASIGRLEESFNDAFVLVFDGAFANDITERLIDASKKLEGFRLHFRTLVVIVNQRNVAPVRVTRDSARFGVALVHHKEDVRHTAIELGVRRIIPIFRRKLRIECETSYRHEAVQAVELRKDSAETV